MNITRLKNDHPRSEHIRCIRRQTRFHFIIGAYELRCHSSVGSLEPSRRSLGTVQTGDTDKPEVIESCTAQLVENIIPKLEMARHYQLRLSIEERDRVVPLSNPLHDLEGM